MTRSEIVKRELRGIGSQSEIAYMLGVRQQAVSKWVAQGYVPDRILRLMMLVFDIKIELLRRPLI